MVGGNEDPLMGDLLGDYAEETEREMKSKSKVFVPPPLRKYDPLELDEIEQKAVKPWDMDDQTWKDYVDKHPNGLLFLDFIPYVDEHFPEVVWVDLIFNQAKRDRVTTLANMAIDLYNARHDTAFVAYHVVKSTFGERNYSMDQYYITFFAKDTHTFKEFVGMGVHKPKTSQDFVVFCGERFRPKLPENTYFQDLLIDIIDSPKSSNQIEEEDGSNIMGQKYLAKLQESGLSLLDQPFYPEFAADKVLPGQDPEGLKFVHVDEKELNEEAMRARSPT